MARAAKFGFTNDFYLYCSKKDKPFADYDHLLATAQSVSRLCCDLPSYAGNYILFDHSRLAAVPEKH